MRKSLLVTSCILSLAASLPPSPAYAEGVSFPSSGTYSIYILGSRAGESTFTARFSGGRIEIHSRTEVLYGDFYLSLETTTKADTASWQPVSFRYEGISEGKSVSGEVIFRPDSIVGTMRTDGAEFPSKTATRPYETLIFENYVGAHEILLARAFLRRSEDFHTFFLFFPSSFTGSKTMISYESEIELEAKDGPLLCSKLQVDASGSFPFFPYVDPDTGLPVYLDFPGANTEMFLERYFGKRPTPKYPIKQE